MGGEIAGYHSSMPHSSPGPTRHGATAVGPFDVSWTELGSDDAPRVLLLHGLYAGAHSYEWRALTPLLAETHRVRVPDLLGAGHSDRPDLEYTRTVVQGVVDDVIRDAGEDTTVVASSLTGAYALRSAIRGVTSARLVLLTPTGIGAPRERPPGHVSDALYQLARHTPVGDALVTALTSAPSVRWFQTNKTYHDPTFLTDDELVATRRAGRDTNAKHLQLAFVFGRLALDLAPDDIRRVAPTVIWGCGQGFVDNRERLRWEEAGARVVSLPSGLPQVEEPDRVAAVIAAD